MGGSVLLRRVLINPAHPMSAVGAKTNFAQTDLAPSANFIRTARTALIAVVVGEIAGASVVLPLVERPAGESSVAARTLVASVPVDTPRAAQISPQAAIQDQPMKSRSDRRRPVG